MVGFSCSLTSFSQKVESNSSSLLQIYSLSVKIMALTQSFNCIMDVSIYYRLIGWGYSNYIKLMITTLRSVISTDIIMAVVDHLYCYADIWQCMGGLGALVVELDNAQQSLKARGQQSRLLFDLLELDGGRYLTPASRDRINYEIIQFTMVSYCAAVP